MSERTPNSELRTPNLNRLTGLLLDWFAANARDLPWRRTRDPYAIWVSEIMLQQTQIKTVIPYWECWMRELPDIRALAKASPAKIHKLWEGLGYYTRVRNLQKAARQIVAQRDSDAETRTSRGNEPQTNSKLETPHVVSGKFPDRFDDVLALPGIGRYTAGAICSIAFNQPTPILDGNVIRVLTRIFGIGGNPREKKTNARLWQLAEGLVIHASRFAHHASRHGSRTGNEDKKTPACSHLNQSLMELGALICTPRSPQCEICPVKKYCVACRENRTGQLPNLDKRAAATTRHFVALVVEQKGRFLVRQRPAGVINAHLWEFPNVEIASRNGGNGRESAHSSRKQRLSRLTSAATVREADPEIIRAAMGLGIVSPALQPLGTVKHSITRYRITLEAFHVHLGGRSSKPPKLLGTRSAHPPENGVWRTPAQLNRLAFASAHKKLASLAAGCILSGR